MRKLLVTIICAITPTKKLRVYLRQHFSVHVKATYTPEEVVIIHRFPNRRNQEAVELKNKVCFFHHNRVEPGTRIGRYSYFNGYTCIGKNTIIGRYCSVGKMCSIAVPQHPLSYLSTAPAIYNPKGTPYQNKETRIGNDVWIGDGVTIKSGIIIGDGVIIGAGAVVVKDVPPYAIVGGVPARIIRYRFSEEIILQLLQNPWWILPHEEILQLPVTSVEQSLESLRKLFRNNLQ